MRVSGPTRRLAILGAVFVMLLITLIPTARAYLEQRRELAALRSQVAEQERAVRELEADKQRWTDPAYIEQQARQRLKFVRPGETAYTVLGVDALDHTRQGEVRGQLVAPLDAGAMPWYAQVWSSIQLTDGLGRGTTRLDGGTVPTPSLAPTTTAPTATGSASPTDQAELPPSIGGRAEPTTPAEPSTPEGGPTTQETTTG